MHIADNYRIPLIILVIVVIRYEFILTLLEFKHQRAALRVMDGSSLDEFFILKDLDLTHLQGVFFFVQFISKQTGLFVSELVSVIFSGAEVGYNLVLDKVFG